jgi:predicted GIY-YIG superfamily endonuclease
MSDWSAERMSLSDVVSVIPGKVLVYVLECCTPKHYYIGHTRTNRRLIDHVNGYGAEFTKMHGVRRIAHYEHLDDLESAKEREKELTHHFALLHGFENVAGASWSQCKKNPEFFLE